ncbi:MAG: SLBB domain-containing protein [Acidobacteria bacterium]|nr:SLBB domain-containing protein [Acidobacteriota bacterium]MCA1640139.1 SLBB domain-containing protein [Acidobacteriota bacterium]
MKFKVFLFFALAICLFQVAFGQDVLVTPEAERGYLVGPGDEITGKVLGEPEFDFVATIDEDGKFQVPFFDKSVYAKCRTEKELRADVTKLLSKFLKNPQVSVRVTQRKSRPPASIYGEVKTPGQVDLRRKATLLELLSFAGGITEDAGGMIQVFHTQPLMCSEGNEDTSLTADSSNNLDVPSRTYSLSSVKQGLEASNPVIYPGDVIVVQKAAPVYVTGEVIQPANMRLTEGGLSLTQAIAMVGGVKREAKTKEIKIYRLKANSKDREIIAVNYDRVKKGEQKDVMLEPYDIVEVDKSKKSIQQIVFEAITGGVKTLATQSLPMRILY